MNILIVDAQGGGLGRQLVSAVKQNLSGAVITAVGTNSAATAAMLRAGADKAATGENAVAVACRRADIIIGPIGIVIADSLMGEITPAMAVAIGQSSAAKILIPINQCNNIIAGVSDLSISWMLQSVLKEIKKITSKARE